MNDDLAVKLESLRVTIDLGLRNVDHRLAELAEGIKDVRADYVALEARVRALETGQAVSKVKLGLLMGLAGVGGGGVAAFGDKIVSLVGGS